MRHLKWAAISALLATIACSGEDVRPPANLSGTWLFSYNTTSAAGDTCTSTMSFTISQTDQTFTGVQHNAGTLSCTGGSALVLAGSSSASDPNEFDSEVISSGIVSETEVLFNLNSLLGTSHGTIDKNGQMSGTTTWQLSVRPHGSVTFTGTWTAVKQ